MQTITNMKVIVDSNTTLKRNPYTLKPCIYKADRASMAFSAEKC